MSTRDTTTGRYQPRASKNARKLLCPRCGERKWKRDFYLFKSGLRKGQYSTYCRACCADIHKQYYRYRQERVALCKDGTIRHIVPGGNSGKRLCGCKLDWSETKLEKLRRDFPTTKNEDLAIDLGVSPRTLVRKARELGLVKSPAWMKAHRDNNLRMMQFINRIHPNSGMFRKGQHPSPATEFKKKQ